MVASARADFSRLEMEEMEAGETDKVGIKGDNSVPTSDGEGGEIGIRPQAVRKGRLGGEGLEMSIQACGFG